MDPVPRFTLGSADGEAPYLFSGRPQVARIGSEYLVVDRQAREVRFFAADGRFLRSVFGTRGNGPGDFESIELVPGLYADSLLLFDRRNRRFTLLARDGSGFRTFREPPRPPMEIVQYVGAFGSTIVEQVYDGEGMAVAQQRGGYFQMQAQVAAIEPERDRRVDVGVFAGLASDYPSNMPDFTAPPMLATQIFHVPFTVHPGVAVGPRSFFVTDGMSPEIREFDGAGTLIRVIRLREPPRPITAEDLEAALERHDGRRFGSLDEVRARARRLPLPEVWPSFERLLVDADGWLWAQVPYHLYGATSWIVFDPEGRAHGRMEMPAGMAGPYTESIGADYLLRVGSGDLGELVIFEFALRREPDPSRSQRP